MKNRIIFSTILILLVVTLNVLLFCVDKKNINNSFKLNSNNIAVMVFDETENDYVRQNSVPTGDYVLNESLSYCEGKGVIDDYDNVLGVVTTKIKGQDKCYFYFDAGEYELVTKDFYYTGGEQTLTLPKTGDVTIEVWGAQGGSANTMGGYGAYAIGTVNLQKDTILYINVGGAGTNASKPTAGVGGYNGGANGGEGNYSSLNGGGGGGGASSVALSTGTLYALGQANKQSDVIIVAAGGGGGGHGSTVGYAGGIESNIVYDNNSPTSQSVDKATQSTGYAFGLGQTGRKATTSSGSNVGEGSGGGGGGYYGGYAKQTTANNTALSGTGGSSYIGYSTLTDKKMVCYTGCTTNSSVATKTDAVNCYNTEPTANCTKSGNGHIRITYLAKVSGTKTFTTKNETQTYVIPKTGNYKIEVWGAQGGGRTSGSQYGGYGSYSVGTINLTKNTTLYINVGSKGGDASTPTGGAGGYNGGGTGGNAYQNNLYGGGGGGGASSVALSTGTLYALGQANKQNDVIIVAGGGGGSGNETTLGHAGGKQSLTVYAMSGGNTLSSPYINPATQSTGYAFGLGQNGRTSTAGYSNGGEGAGGGGGGYYGGYASSNIGTSTAIAGTGGSGYIGYSTLTNKKMVCYTGCTADSNTSTYTVVNSCADETASPDCSKIGDGFVKITLLDNNYESLSSKIVAGTSGTHNSYAYQIVSEGDGTRYEGKDPANYVCFSSSCTNDTLYRIVGVFTEMVDTTGNGTADTNQSVIKITKEVASESRAYSTSNNNNWANASLNTYLNGTWAKPYNNILTVRWYLKAPTSAAYSASDWLSYERNGSVYSGYPQYIDSKIALPYASDFGYGALSSQCGRSTSLGYGGYNNGCYQYTWLFDQNNDHYYYYLITPYPSDTNHAYYVDGYGYVAYSYGSNYVSSELRVKPTFYLSIDTQITGGTGTKVDPYIIY